MESLAERRVSGEVSAGEFCVSHGRFRGHSEETGKHARRGVSDHVALCGRAVELALLFPASGRDRDMPPTRTGNQAASLTSGGPLDRGPLLGVSWAYSESFHQKENGRKPGTVYLAHRLLNPHHLQLVVRAVRGLSSCLLHGFHCEHFFEGEL